MTNIFSAMVRRAGRRKIYADLLDLDDRLLKDMGITRSEVHVMLSGRRTRATRAHE